MNDIDYRKLLLQFIGSLSLASHMGDVSNDVAYVLQRMGMEMEIEWEEWSDLRRALAAQGVTTLYGTQLTGE